MALWIVKFHLLLITKTCIPKKCSLFTWLVRCAQRIFLIAFSVSNSIISLMNCFERIEDKKINQDNQPAILERDLTANGFCLKKNMGWHLFLIAATTASHNGKPLRKKTPFLWNSFERKIIKKCFNEIEWKIWHCVCVCVCAS